MSFIDNIKNNEFLLSIINFFNDDDLLFFFIKILATLFIIVLIYFKFLHYPLSYKVKRFFNGKKLDELGENNVYNNSVDIFEDITSLKKEVNKELNPEVKINDIAIKLNKIYKKLKEISDRMDCLNNEYQSRKRIIEETYNSLSIEYTQLLQYHNYLQQEINKKKEFNY
jgi:hypothetical protein